LINLLGKTWAIQNNNQTETLDKKYDTNWRACGQTGGRVVKLAGVTITKIPFEKLSYF
jgi:hypothetical protein